MVSFKVWPQHKLTGRTALFVAVLVCASIAYVFSPIAVHWITRVAIIAVALAPVFALLIFRLVRLIAALWWKCEFRYSTRALLVVTGALAVMLALLGNWTMRAAKTRAQVVALQSLGARLEYDLDSATYVPHDVMRARRRLPKGFFITSLGKKYPTWIRKRLGDYAFGSVVRVDLSGTSISDSDLAHLAGLPKLKELDLSNTKVTGEGFIYLQGTKLHSLHLAATKVKDDTLGLLKDQTSLKYLTLDLTDIADQGLTQLQNMRELSRLSLAGTNVSDKGLGHLARLAQLDTLNLKNTNVSDKGLGHLATLTQLRTLNLKNTGVTRSALLNLHELLPVGCRVEHNMADLIIGNSEFGCSVAIGNQLALVGDLNLGYLFDLSTRKRLLVLWPGKTAGYHSGFGSSVSIDGNIALIGAPNDQCLYVFDVSTGEQLQKLSSPNGADRGFGSSFERLRRRANNRGSSATYAGRLHILDVRCMN